LFFPNKSFQFHTATYSQLPPFKLRPKDLYDSLFLYALSFPDINISSKIPDFYLWQLLQKNLFCDK